MTTMYVLARTNIAFSDVFETLYKFFLYESSDA